ncbi:TorF family putative porin, partial [Rubrimonas sp.]|uniref:TorF family putative porin n=1 Tax=Rubrimonas sp. TaxID=2036015 RepID=UPI002FDD101E
MNMRILVATLAGPGLLAPAVAGAQGLAFFEDNSVTLSAGAALVSEYVSQGFELSDGLALQPYAEVGFGGLYAGFWASNGSEDLLGASGEFDLIAGYRGEYDIFYWDLSYNYYFFTGKTFAEEYGE